MYIIKTFRFEVACVELLQDDIYINAAGDSFEIVEKLSR